MKKLFKTGLIIILAVCLFLPSSLSVRAITATLTDAAEAEKVLALCKAHYGDELAEKMRYLVFESGFRAIGERAVFHPMNKEAYASTLSDGRYEETFRGATGCMAYARWVTSWIYDTDAYSSRVDFNGNMTEAEVRDFILTYCQPGDHLRYEGSSIHSMAFVTGDDEGKGFYELSYRGDSNPYIMLEWYTYTDFIALLKSKGCKLFVFNANKNDNAIGGSVSPTVGKKLLMNRLYNPNTGEHFYTADNAERDNLVKFGWVDETSSGNSWYLPEIGEPVYRLYNPNVPGGDHYYTMDKAEYDGLVSLGWTGEGIRWHSASSRKTPVYVQYNPTPGVSGAHNYTISMTEADTLKKAGWIVSEKPAWYGD